MRHQAAEDALLRPRLRREWCAPRPWEDLRHQTAADTARRRAAAGIFRNCYVHGAFTPNLSQHTATLRDLLKKDAEFAWTPSHENAFQKTKDVICKEVTLSYFDPSAETVVQVDASSRGVGAVLLQHDKPIAFASKSLSECERRYANIEREMLAVVFGCERFHTFVYSKRFTVESDHKPLEMIHLKNLSAAPHRLQRMLLRIQPYDIGIKYKPGKEVAVADLLSRQPSSNNESIDFDVQISHVQLSTRRLQQLRDETNSDDELTSLKSIITSGWPETRRQLATALRPYWAFRDELTVDDGIIMKGDRIIIPPNVRPDILAKLHEAHQGVEKTRLRARTCVFWINMNKDIECMIQKCGICQHELRSQSAEPLMQHDIPTRPWQVVGTDLFSIGRDNYLIVADYHSKFPFVERIEGKATSELIVKLTKRIFSEHGSPDRVISDNGGHFASHAYRLFAEKLGFDHITSSPHFPQSNGFIERQIQTAKRTMKKGIISQSGPIYGNVDPAVNTHRSPATVPSRDVECTEDVSKSTSKNRKQTSGQKHDHQSAVRTTNATKAVSRPESERATCAADPRSIYSHSAPRHRKMESGNCRECTT